MPRIDLFMEKYAFMDDMQEQMTLIKFAAMNELINTGSSRRSPRQSSLALTFRYDGDSQWWIATVDQLLTDWGIDFFVYDSIQFRYANHAVQWPELDSLVGISSYGWFVPYDSTDMRGMIHQHLDFVVDSPAVGILSTHGEGDYNLDFYNTDWITLNIPDCNYILNVWYPSIEFQFGTEMIDQPLEARCPLDGFSFFRGGVTVWDKDWEIIWDGDWEVIKSAYGDSITHAVEETPGKGNWYFSDTCVVPTGGSW
jgi:hypothetical protein